MKQTKFHGIKKVIISQVYLKKLKKEMNKFMYIHYKKQKVKSFFKKAKEIYKKFYFIIKNHFFFQ